jgi:hypothetical protein
MYVYIHTYVDDANSLIQELRSFWDSRPRFESRHGIRFLEKNTAMLLYVFEFISFVLVFKKIKNGIRANILRIIAFIKISFKLWGANLFFFWFTQTCVQGGQISLWKSRPKLPNPTSKLMHQLLLRKKKPNFGLLSSLSKKKLLKENNHPTCEN